MTDDFLFQLMKKRLRKKLRLREFREMGFTADFDVDPNKPELYENLQARLDLLLSSHGLKLVFGFGTLFIKAGQYESVTANTRQLIINWIQQQPEAINLGFGSLEDFRLTQRVHVRRPKWRFLSRKRLMR